MKNLNISLINLTNSYIQPILSEKLELDELVRDKISLIKYTSNDCSDCQQMQPHFFEIKDRLEDENYDMNLKVINCDKYDCSERKISKFPTFALYDGINEAHRTMGVQTYNELTKFILDNTSIDLETFTVVKKNEGVRLLYERDFYDKLDGAWLLLFYKRKSDYMREIFRMMSEEFSGKLHFGEISEANARNIASKHNITNFPAIIGVNEGVEVFYTGERKYDDLSVFSEKLIKPTFSHITWEELKNKDSREPIFIALYKDISLANHYFKQKAHDYKMSTDIYRTTDPEIFQRASIYPSEYDKDDHHEQVGFAVYKNGSFHRFPGKLEDEGALIKWIFHSHFPNLTNLTDENYTNILLGIKPVIMLLSPSEMHIEKFDEVALTVHHGVPFTNYLFAYIDTFKYEEFIPSILPNIQSPSIVLYNPDTRNFYTQKMDFSTSVTMFESITNLIKNYTSNKLKPINSKKKSKLKYYLMGLFIILLASIVAHQYLESRKKEKLKYQI